MKTLLASLWLACAQLVPGTEPALTSVTLPLYFHEGGQDNICIESVPFISFGSAPEWKFSAISTPFVPPSSSRWALAHDVNLASLCRIKVSGTYKVTEANRANPSTDVLVTIDASQAVVPEECPFTLEQVLDAVTTCVKLMHPQRPKQESAMEIVITRPGPKENTPKSSP